MKELMIHAKTWVNLKCIILSESSQTQKATYHIVVVVLVTQSYPTLCDPMDCSLRGSSVHGILQARILEWVAIPFSRGSS